MSTALDQFKLKAKAVLDSKRPRVIFALDATASRSFTWQVAMQLQKEMLQEVGNLKMEMQICFFRGNEFQFSNWETDGQILADLMSTIKCVGGDTQIEKVLAHAIAETQNRQVAAVVYIGDAFEEHPHRAAMKQMAEQLRAFDVKLFMFHEGQDSWGSFDEYQKLTNANGGATLPFDANAIGKVKELLTAIALFAIGGMDALKRSSLPGAKLLLSHIKS